VRRFIVQVKTPFGKERYSEVAESPLGEMNSPDEIDEYKDWPDPDDFDYAVVKAQAEGTFLARRTICNPILHSVASLRFLTPTQSLAAIAAFQPTRSNSFE
jgi:hypothetical protein